MVESLVSVDNNVYIKNRFFYGKLENFKTLISMLSKIGKF